MDKEWTIKEAQREVRKFQGSPKIINMILENLFLSGQIYALEESNEKLRRG